MYETDRLPKDWVNKLAIFDEIWVPTTFHVGTFSKSGVDASRLFVLPEAIDTSFFDPEAASQVSRDNDSSSFSFLSVFKFEERKNWKGLLKAFLTEFGNSEKVRLVIKTSGFHETRSIADQIDSFLSRTIGSNVTLRGLQSENRIEIISKSLSQEEMRDLYKRSGAFVLPSRGEGWGRPHAEAMAMALPVIATNFSGNTAFMNANNSLLVSVERMVRRDPQDSEGHRWAEPSQRSLQDRMRWCVEYPEKGREIGRRAREYMTRHYSRDVVSKLVMERIGELTSTTHTGRREAHSKAEL